MALSRSTENGGPEEVVEHTVAKKKKNGITKDPVNDGEKTNFAERILVQEVHIAKSLASNDLIERNRQLKRLPKWLRLRSGSSFKLTEDDFMHLWKGLYYNMWMSDKPLVQEELAEQLGGLVHCFNGDVSLSVQFYGAFLRTMCQEWFGIDQWRIDKFMMLVRRMTRAMLRQLKEVGWAADAVRLFGDHLMAHVLSAKCKAKGLAMHFLDIFFEELAKVADGDIDEQQVGLFVKPFTVFLCTQTDSKLINHCRSRIFFHLLYQSELGREYTEKYHAWRQMGFPTASIDDLVKDEAAAADGDEDDDDDEDAADGEETSKEPAEKHLDPRAGNVDVLMPLLPLNAKEIIDDLEHYLRKCDYNVRLRKMLKNLLEIFKKYQSGVFPLGVKRMPRFEAEKTGKPLIQDKIEQLDNMENQMFGIGRKLKQLNKRKRRKLLKSLNFDELDEANVDDAIEKALPKQYLQERRKRDQAALMNSWVEEELDAEVQEQPAKKKNKITPKSKENKITPKSKENKAGPKSKENKPGPKSKENKVAPKSKENSSEVPVKKKKNKKPPITPSDGDAVAPKEKAARKGLTEASTNNTETPQAAKAKANEWDEPLAAGEVEYFVPSRKIQLQKANANLVKNPLARANTASPAQTPRKAQAKTLGGVAAAESSTPKTPNSVKRVKIALKHNTAQKPSEYVKQILSSPDVPYDASRKPSKGVLKPNLMPGPINPFYKKKIGLTFLNETL